nr:geranylgeranyl transferase type-1 subunit beta [Ipomoea batatas]GMD12203.1 geranylgeranyl transferase type-1 subunit beta [Ipomoea batatas]GMD19349.1 geranylgeranyl transferase type-1 subunit beta [Ipomoea batatas]GME18277.1 geranylgeranyl transferase type-1 subunit beta [Ipomoea batatas]
MAEDDDTYWDPTDPDPDPTSALDFFDRDRHLCYSQMMLELLPSAYQGQEINRLTLAYFAISGLDILGGLDRVDKAGVINWVLSLQAHPRNEAELENGQFYGFHGSRSSQFESSDNEGLIPNGSHLASTYCALAILKTVGYDLSFVDSTSILKSMRSLQQPDGSFMPIHIGAETDLRFVYCAAAICSMLENWNGMDREKAKEYILNCQSYDGGFGLTPGSESHGGATYCAIASLRLMGLIEDDLFSKTGTSCCINVPLLLDWTLQRQGADGGFQGRLNKPSDTCYAFWVGGVLKILGANKLIDKKGLHDFLYTCQSQYGGFGKVPGALPDLYHSYYGFCAFSLLEEPGLASICIELGITDSAVCGF